MTFTTLIPIMRKNADGSRSRLTRHEQRAILGEFTVVFGSYTRKHFVRGAWTDPNGGKVEFDLSMPVEVSCDSLRILEVFELVRSIGRRLGQDEMYLEVADFGTVFLKV